MWIFDENGIASLLLRYWGPPTITVIVGGALASLLFPRWQNRAARAKAFNDRRFETLEEIAESFPRYVAAWRRLIQISELEQSRALSEEEAERKRLFVAQRNEARDALCSALSRSQIYFSEPSWDTIRKFLEWDEGNSAKRLGELPGIEEWRRWETRVLGQLRSRERG